MASTNLLRLVSTLILGWAIFITVPLHAGDFDFRQGQDALATGRYEDAIASFSKVIGSNPESDWAYESRGIAYERVRDYERALADYLEALRLHPDSLTVLENLARLLTTCPKAEIRDGAKAVQYATKACEVTSWQTPRCISALAAACSEAGDFDKAVEYQTKYRNMPDLDKKADADADLYLAYYKGHHPWREIAEMRAARERPPKSPEEAYGVLIRSQLAKKWRVLCTDKKDALGKGSVILHFSLDKDGKVNKDDLKVTSKEGNAIVEEVGTTAVLQAEFPPIPVNVLTPGKNRFEMKCEMVIY